MTASSNASLSVPSPRWSQPAFSTPAYRDQRRPAAGIGPTLARTLLGLLLTMATVCLYWAELRP